MVNKKNLYSLARVGNLSAIIQLDQSEILDLFLHDSERLPVRSFAAWFHHDRIAQNNIEAKAKKTPGFPVLIINDSSTDKKTQCIPLWLEIQQTSLGYISTCNFDAVVQQVVLQVLVLEAVRAVGEEVAVEVVVVVVAKIVAVVEQEEVPKQTA